MTINNEQNNKNAARLGDRVLSAFIGKEAGGNIAFSTYSYTDLNKYLISKFINLSFISHGNPNVY